MNEFYTRLSEKAELLATTLAPIAFLLMVCSLWSSVNSGNRSATMYMRALVHAIVAVIVLSQFSSWIETGETVVKSLVYDTLQADPGKVYQKYKAMTAASSDEAEGGFWHTIFNLSDREFFKVIISAVLWIAQFIAKIVVFIAYVIYKVVLAFAIAASPIFIGFLSLRSLTSIGMRFILGTVGILLWPLGWGFASLVTDTLLEIMSQDSFVAATGMEELKNLIAVAAAGLWIVFSTIAAPLAIQKMITEGSNIGATFLQGGLKAARAGMQTGAAAGATLATSGVGAPLAAVGAGAAGALAFGSSSLSGAGYSSVGEVVGNVARMGAASSSCSSSSSKGKTTGGGSSKSSTAANDNSPKSSYQSSDPANDRQAAAIIAKARKSNHRAS